MLPFLRSWQKQNVPTLNVLGLTIRTSVMLPAAMELAVVRDAATQGVSTGTRFSHITFDTLLTVLWSVISVVSVGPSTHYVLWHAFMPPTR